MPDPITDKDALLPPLSFRRGLVFGTGFSLLLLSIITVRNMWLYFDNNTTNINEFLLLIFSSWGISYVTFLWLSFFVIVIKKLPSCAWTGIKKGLLKNGDVHICVDSVLNARQDMEQKKSGISVELLETEGSRLWIIGLIALLILAYVLTLDIIPIYLRLIMLGEFHHCIIYMTLPSMNLVRIEDLLMVWEIMESYSECICVGHQRIRNCKILPKIALMVFA